MKNRTPRIVIVVALALVAGGGAVLSQEGATKVVREPGSGKTIATLQTDLGPPPAVAAPTRPLESSTFVKAPTVGCSRIEISASDFLFSDGFESGDRSAWRAPNARFSATRILDLDLVVHFTDTSPDGHVLHLKLLTPKGHHYQTLDTPIAFGLSAARPNSVRRIEGYPHPLPVRLATPENRAGEPVHSVSVPFPVAGTVILTSSLYGLWTVEARLDGASVACATARFHIVR
jgi:hypothetical protein